MQITLPVNAKGSCGSTSDAARFLVPGAGLLLALFGTAGAPAGFVPGYLYVSDPRTEPCGSVGARRDQVWEVNPATGASRLFATVPPEFCGGLIGLAFTPDGSRLRASAFLSSEILEIDGDGGVSVALDGSDGIGGPQGLNNLAYDAAGNFYVGNLFPQRLLKFPAAGGPPETLLDLSDGLTGSLSLAVGPDGSVWAGELAGPGDQVWRFLPDGTVSTFPLGALGAQSIAVDSSGNVFLHSGVLGIYKIVNGDPSNIVQLTAQAFPQGVMALSPAGDELFVCGGASIYQIDPGTGESTLVVHGLGINSGLGAAFHVPEPASAALFLSLGFLRGSRGVHARNGYKG